MPTIVQIQLRRDTAANWASNNPVLASGEPGYDITNRLQKIGDGISAWNDLDGVNQDIFSYTAGEAIGGDKVVVIKSGEVFLFDPTDITHLGRVVGISANSAVLGDPVTIVTDNNQSTGLTLTDGAIYFGGASGTITTTAPTTDISQVIGIAISTSELLIDIRTPILKS